MSKVQRVYVISLDAFLLFLSICMSTDLILFYRCLRILDMRAEIWIMKKFLTKNIILLMTYCIVISEHISIESRNLF